MFQKVFKNYIKYTDKAARERTSIFLFVMAFAGIGAALLGGYFAHNDEIRLIISLVGAAAYITMIMLVGFQKMLYERESRLSEDQKKEIRDLNAAQSHFFSSMSHELRTPINTIIGLNEMILRENKIQEIREDAQYIKSASNMLLHLVNDILDVSKLNTGQMHLVIAPYNLGEMLSEVMGMLWHSAREKGLNFNVDVEGDVPSGLLGDEIRIKQILINILNNAIKYTDEGSVLLTVQCQRWNEREVSIIFNVSDTGIGIRKESIPYLFTAFSRVDETKNRHIEGTGLGLSIVRQFVEMMDGKVTVNSVYTKGSTFIIEIPQEIVDDSGDVRVELEHRQQLATSSGYMQSFEAPDARVLVVDDTLPNLIVVQKMLKHTKVHIVTAESGKEALRKTQTQAFDVIFMDHMMPEMDGIECFHRIRSQAGGKSSDAKVVAFTANADDENRFLYEREGFDGYLVKPVSGKDLEYELLRLLPGDLVKLTDGSKTTVGTMFARMKQYRKKASVIITTESISGMSPDTREKYKISIIPYTIITEEGNFRDRMDIEADDALEYSNKGKRIEAKAPTVEEYEQFFADCLTNANNIIHIALASGVGESGYTAAKEAARAFENVFIVDSGHLVGGVNYLATEAGRMAEGAMGAAEILNRLENLKDRVETSQIIDKPDFLDKDETSLIAVHRITMSFMMRPVIKLTQDKIKIIRLLIGSRERAWKKYLAFALRYPNRIDDSVAYISYAGLSDEELDFIEKEAMKRLQFKRIVFSKMSPAMAIRCRARSFGVLFTYRT